MFVVQFGVMALGGIFLGGLKGLTKFLGESVESHKVREGAPKLSA
jgi:hypothetical protein